MKMLIVESANGTKTLIPFRNISKVDLTWTKDLPKDSPELWFVKIELMSGDYHTCEFTEDKEKALEFFDLTVNSLKNNKNKKPKFYLFNNEKLIKLNTISNISINREKLTLLINIKLDKNTFNHYSINYSNLLLLTKEFEEAVSLLSYKHENEAK